LAKEVLAEVPRQMVDYFVSKNIKPNPRSLVDREQIRIRNEMRNKMAAMMNVPDSFF